MEHPEQFPWSRFEIRTRSGEIVVVVVEEVVVLGVVEVMEVMEVVRTDGTSSVGL